MFMFPMRGRSTVATTGWMPVLVLSLVTACSETSPVSPSASTGTRSGLAGQVAANDSIINLTASATQRDGSTSTPRTPISSDEPGLGLPASLALTPAQQQQLNALRAAHAQQTAADVAAYNAILAQARAARVAGASAATIDSIVATGTAVQKRLEAADAALLKNIDALLTPAQRQWLQTCQTTPALSQAQAEQIAALERAFASANAADLAAIESALANITRLRGSGQSSSSIETQVRDILNLVTPARERVRAAQQKLAADIAQIMGTSPCQG
jgi:hypothetical protein